MNVLCLQAFGLAPKTGHALSSTRSSIAVARQENIYVIYNKNMLFLIKSNSECLSYALEEAKATLVLSILFVSCEEKDCYRDFSIGQVGFFSHSILRAQPVHAITSSK